MLDARLEDSGDVVQAHCANTGSMLGINTPGSRCLLLEVDNPKRRLRYTLEAVDVAGVWVGAHPIRANTIGREALEAGMVREVPRIAKIRAEVAYGTGSRADLELTTETGERWMVEIKSASLAVDGVSMFPDAVTVRGQKHLDELVRVVEQGSRAMMLFVATRSDVTKFSPAAHIDPVYARKLRDAASNGVVIAAINSHVTPTKMVAKSVLSVGLGVRSSGARY